MKKITILLITLFTLTCFASADYTLKKTIGGVSVSTTVPEGRSVTLKYLKDASIFIKWLVKSGNVTLSNETDTTVTFTMPANDVEIQATLTTDHTCVFSEATCTTPPTCSCGATNGSALGHEFTGTRTCNVNGSTDTVQCIRCSATESQTCTHTYTISNGTTTNGTITLSATSVKAGGSATATITPSSGYEIDTITVNGSSITVSNTAGMTYTFSNVTVNQTINVTFSKSVVIANANVAIGAYIAYTPTATSAKVYEEDSGYGTDDTNASEYQEFNPSNTTSWQVMYNNNGQLDIVSADAVYAINRDGLYLQGATGYAKVVDTLNNLCSAYVNTTYATSGRSIGCTSSSTGTITTSITWDYTYNKGNIGLPYTDTYYSADVNQLTNNNLLLGSDYTWLASRSLEAESDASYFYVDICDPAGGSISHIGFLTANSDGTEYWTRCAVGVRPIVSLKSEIKIVSGSGTKTDPYVIE